MSIVEQTKATRSLFCHLRMIRKTLNGALSVIYIDCNFFTRSVGWIVWNVTKWQLLRVIIGNVVTIRFVNEIRNKHRNLEEISSDFSSFMFNCDVTDLLLGAKCTWSNRKRLHTSIEFWFQATGKRSSLILFNRHCQNLYSDICPLMVYSGDNWGLSQRTYDSNTLILRSYLSTKKDGFKELIKNMVLRIASLPPK